MLWSIIIKNYLGTESLTNQTVFTGNYLHRVTPDIDSCHQKLSKATILSLQNTINSLDAVRDFGMDNAILSFTN